MAEGFSIQPQSSLPLFFQLSEHNQNQQYRQAQIREQESLQRYRDAEIGKINHAANKEYATNTAFALALKNGDPEAADLVAQSDPTKYSELQKVVKESQVILGQHAAAVYYAPLKDKPRIWKEQKALINSNPAIPEYMKKSIVDEYTPDRDSFLYSAISAARTIEDQRKAEKEAVELTTQKAINYGQSLDNQKKTLELNALKKSNGQKAPEGYRYTQNGELEAIPGGPALKMTPEQAGKVALIDQGALDVKRFSDSVMDKDGSYNRSKLAALFTPGSPGARKEYSTLFNAMNARLRLESGSAVPPAEVKAAIKTFAPGPTDSDETIKSKIDRMGEFFQLAHDQIGQGRGKSPRSPEPTDFKPEEYKDVSKDAIAAEIARRAGGQK